MGWIFLVWCLHITGQCQWVLCRCMYLCAPSFFFPGGKGYRLQVNTLAWPLLFKNPLKYPFLKFNSLEQAHQVKRTPSLSCVAASQMPRTHLFFAVHSRNGVMLICAGQTPAWLSAWLMSQSGKFRPEAVLLSKFWAMPSLNWLDGLDLCLVAALMYLQKVCSGKTTQAPFIFDGQSSVQITVLIMFQLVIWPY